MNEAEFNRYNDCPVFEEAQMIEPYQLAPEGYYMNNLWDEECDIRNLIHEKIKEITIN